MEKWALAMEGGSLRCMFSAGAVYVMMERQLWANGVFGVSAGALTGVNYVSRQVGRSEEHTSELQSLPPISYAVFQHMGRSEERRVGKECASKCRSRWSPYH